MSYTTKVMLLAILPLCAGAQQLEEKTAATNPTSAERAYEKQGGYFSLGVRNTFSAFSHDGKEFGYGAGGHFRIQIIDRVNTEWYGDVISTDIKGKAHRTDYHVGWSVMFYVIDPHGFNRKVTPYVLAGHCFDWTKIKVRGDAQNYPAKFSSAVHFGAGANFNITPKIDLSITAQYMMHLGKELHADVEGDTVKVEEENNPGWQGHLLISVSVNYKMFRLWKPKSRIARALS